MRQPKILSTIQNYSWQLFVADIWAGVTVAMVAIPLSIAIAVASGANPAQGLVTAIIGGFFISLLGGSRVQIGGPTGAFIVVVYGIIAEHGYDGLILATFMAGILMIIAGHFRAGNLIAYVPEAVVNGFTIGIGIILAASQLKDFFGLSIDTIPADFIGKIPILWNAKGSLNHSAVLVAVISLVLIVGLRRMAPKFPGLIVAIAIGSSIVFWGELPVDTIGLRYGSLPNSLPLPKLPIVTLDLVLNLLPSAIVIAFLASVESLLSALVADRMVDGKHRPNAEVTAQGIANVASSMFGGLPVTGAIARTATNVNAGGKTPIAGIVHAIVILIVMLIASTWAGYLAMPALAGLLMVIAWNMSEPHKWRSYMNGRTSDIILLLMTTFLTVFVDLTVAIGVGVSLGLAIRLRRRKLEPTEWSETEH